MDVTHRDPYTINRRREARHQLDTLARKAIVIVEPRPWDLPGTWTPARRTADDFRRAAADAAAAGRKGSAAAYRAHATMIDQRDADTRTWAELIADQDAAGIIDIEAVIDDGWTY